jgi:cytochrome c oxidase subunit II
LAPHSPGTDQIDTLLWIGLAAAAIVVVAILGALLLALRHRRAVRDGEPPQVTGGRRVQFQVGAVLTVFAAAIFVVSIIFTDRARQTPVTGPAGLQTAHSEPLQVETTGQRWLWRFQYPNGAFSYYKLVVPVDTAVELNLVSTDVIHTWNVPDLTAKADAVPGKTNHVYFRADEEGNFYGQAATFSGQAYAAMRINVEVVSPTAYKSFISQQKSEIQAAQDRVVGLIENGETP